MKFNDNTPIYLQIVEKIKADIVAGKLKGGDKLPSVREIAESFNVNPNTVQRVYMELELWRDSDRHKPANLYKDM
jgi:GntR family transcriptional regulator